jgi:hypothetical protein
MRAMSELIPRITSFLTQLISETNGLALEDTLLLAEQSPQLERDNELAHSLRDFHALLGRFRLNAAPIETLLAHPVSEALAALFRSFPIPFRDEHTHLTGSLDAAFIFTRLEPLLGGPQGPMYESKIAAVYGAGSLPIRSVQDVDRLIRLGENDRFDRYLKILYLAKLILTSREAHRDAAYHMASRLYRSANVGSIRLKFTAFRETTDPTEQIPGIEKVTPEDADSRARFRRFASSCHRASGRSPASTTRSAIPRNAPASTTRSGRSRRCCRSIRSSSTSSPKWTRSATSAASIARCTSSRCASACGSSRPTDCARAAITARRGTRSVRECRPSTTP